MSKKEGDDWKKSLWDGIRISPREDFSWFVEICIPTTDVDDEILSQILRTAKRKISKDFGVPLEIPGFCVYRSNVSPHG